jgi:hypothetical protein
MSSLRAMKARIGKIADYCIREFQSGRRSISCVDIAAHFGHPLDGAYITQVQEDLVRVRARLAALHYATSLVSAKCIRDYADIEVIDLEIATQCVALNNGNSKPSGIRQHLGQDKVWVMYNERSANMGFKRQFTGVRRQVEGVGRGLAEVTDVRRMGEQVKVGYKALSELATEPVQVMLVNHEDEQ